MPRDVVVIGGGPAGLSAAAVLQRAGARVVVLERAGGVGASWRERYARLRLNTVRWMSGLPHRPIPRRLGRWVAREDFVRYLEGYARDERLDVRTGVEARRVDPGWVVRTTAGDFPAGAVVVATGFDHTPFMPAWPGADGFTGELLHASRYRDAVPFRGRDVLIAGTGATGLEIATELAGQGAGRVWLAQRTAPTFFSRELLGLPITPLGPLGARLPQVAGDRLGRAVERIQRGRLDAYGMPPAERGMLTRLSAEACGPVIVDGIAEALRAGRVRVVGALEGFDGDAALLAGGGRVRPDVVVAATGYRRGLEGLVGHLGVLAANGEPVVESGAADPRWPGLGFVGYRVPLHGQLFVTARDARRLPAALGLATGSRRAA